MIAPVQHSPEATLSDAPSVWEGVWPEAIGWLIIIAWQTWLALGLFGDQPWRTLLDERPLSSGAYPLHLYIGTIGAHSLYERGHSSVFDPAFQAGYPKTPIFDGGRSAELMLFLTGGAFQPAAQKLGVLLHCIFVPVFVLIAGRSCGLSFSTSAVAAVFAMIIWWGPIGRGALEAGDTEILLASLAGLAHTGFLVAYDRQKHFPAWLGAAAAATCVWFFQPLLFPIALPMLLVYYLSVGAKHPFFPWHFGFWSAEALAVVINHSWLTDWVNYWWLRASLPNPAAVLARPNLTSLWTSNQWGGSLERNLAMALMLGAVPGLLFLNWSHHRVAARLLGLGGAGALVLSLLAITWEPLGVVGTSALLGPALWFCCLPAAFAWTTFGNSLARFGRLGRAGYFAMLAITAGVVFLIADHPWTFLNRFLKTTPLPVGLTDAQHDVVKKIRDHTTQEGRILWEDRAISRAASRWPALLPILTERAYIGGLDPDSVIEHSSINLTTKSLEGRPIDLVKAQDLDEYCARYNVGWIVAWTEPVKIRIQAAWPNVQKLAVLQDGEEGALFRVPRPSLNFALRGKATLEFADSQQIVLRDVEPDADGSVVLSLHYQTGMTASLSRVAVSRSPSSDDPIGFVRLTLNERAATLTLKWRRR